MPTAPLIYSAKIGSTMAGQTSQAWRQVRGEVPIEPIEVSRSDLRLTVRYRSLDDDIANSAPEPVTDFWEWRGALYRRFHCCGSYVKPAAARSDDPMVRGLLHSWMVCMDPSATWPYRRDLSSPRLSDMTLASVLATSGGHELRLLETDHDERASEARQRLAGAFLVCGDALLLRMSPPMWRVDADGLRFYSMPAAQASCSHFDLNANAEIDRFVAEIGQHAEPGRSGELLHCDLPPAAFARHAIRIGIEGLTLALALANVTDKSTRDRTGATPFHEKLKAIHDRPERPDPEEAETIVAALESVHRRLRHAYRREGDGSAVGAFVEKARLRFRIANDLYGDLA